MALYYDLPIYKDTYELLLKLFQYTKEFPKEYKYTLADKMRSDALLLVRSIYQANKSESKRQPLDVFMDDFEVLKLELRLCVDMKLLPIKRHVVLATIMERIGRQITGWRRASV